MFLKCELLGSLAVCVLSINHLVNMTLINLLLLYFILFDRDREKSPICCFTPQMLAKPTLHLAQDGIQEHNPGSIPGDKNPAPCCLREHLSRKLVWGPEPEFAPANFHVQSRHPKWWLIAALNVTTEFFFHNLDIT